MYEYVVALGEEPGPGPGLRRARVLAGTKF